MLAPQVDGGVRLLCLVGQPHALCLLPVVPKPGLLSTPASGAADSQALGGSSKGSTTNDPKDGRVVGLDCMYDIDPSIGELADLPLGWRAWRKDIQSPWQREPKAYPTKCGRLRSLRRSQVPVMLHVTCRAPSRHSSGSRFAGGSSCRCPVRFPRLPAAPRNATVGRLIRAALRIPSEPGRRSAILLAGVHILV
jgi:hypothetical protein